MDRYTFESRESYEKAVKEEELIQQLKKKADLKNNKTVLKLYNKLVAEKTFSTVIGYDFLEELRTQILKSGLVSEELLPEIPVKVEEKKEQDHFIYNGLKYAHKVIDTRQCDVVVLDEVLGLLDLGLLKTEELVEMLENRSDDQLIIMTGRQIPDELIPYTDAVYCISTVKESQC